MHRQFTIALLLSSSVLCSCTGETVDVPPEQNDLSSADSDSAEGELGATSFLSAPNPSGFIYAFGNERMTFELAQERQALGTGDLTVLMIVDRSGSMATTWDGTTKWQIVRSSLDAAIVGVEEDLTIGALFFPMGEECGVSPFFDSGHIQFQKGVLFQNELEQFSDELGGGTPLYFALLQADEAIMRAAMDGALEKRFRVVIMTDGEPNCVGTEQEMFVLTDSWRDAGIDVRVMGLPGSESAARFLDRLAGKETAPGEPYVAPPTVVDTSSSAEDTGYVAPSSSEDVDDSLHLVVR